MQLRNTMQRFQLRKVDRTIVNQAYYPKFELISKVQLI